jgi:3-methyladenine DNA glycosylase AlkD
MEIIGSKAKVLELLEPALKTYSPKKEKAFVELLHKQILCKKIRFPQLENAAKELYKTIPANRHLAILDQIISLPEVGTNVIAGIILQLRLKAHFKESIDKALLYITIGDAWFVCDIIGERVLGYALLTEPEKTLLLFKKLTKHENKWAVRSIGVATHYAVKNGLKKEFSERSFQILLLCSTVTDFHTKKGIGWAAKTIAKLHPDIIKKYDSEISNNPNIKQWFKTKIKIGLGRSFKYASRYID